ncbi:MAG: sugar ABC transporter ATP-binding protein [Candidatus Aenigmatarchaeota archaeon]
MSKKNNIILKVENLSKRFPGTIAVDRVNLAFEEGRIYGIVGENGAGKSTFIKLLTGIEKPTEGKIFIKDKEVNIRNPKDSGEKYGIYAVFQEDVAIPLLSVAENIFLGKENIFYKNGLISFSLLYKTSEEVIKKLNLDLDVKKSVQSLSLSERKLLSIAKALYNNPKILILDEATAPLSKNEVNNVFRILKEYKQKGTTILFISHRLMEVLEISDIIIVMKDGKVVAEMENINLTPEQVVEKMIGTKIELVFPEKAIKVGDPILSVRNLKLKHLLNNINFDLHRGEIVALAGLRGQGQEKLLEAIYGLEKLDNGEIYLSGKKLEIKNPLDAIKYGIIYISDKRDYEELWPSLSVIKNMSMASLDKVSKFGFIKFKKERQAAENMVNFLNIRVPSLDGDVMYLSGGNKQKVALSKWLLKDGKVMLLNKPTDGIDVATKMEIYHILRRLANQGKAILTFLSELPEVLNLPDRILVLREGTIVKEFKGQVSEKELLMSYYEKQ